MKKRNFPRVRVEYRYDRRPSEHRFQGEVKDYIGKAKIYNKRPKRKIPGHPDDDDGSRRKGGPRWEWSWLFWDGGKESGQVNGYATSKRSGVLNTKTQIVQTGHEGYEAKLEGRPSRGGGWYYLILPGAELGGFKSKNGFKTVKHAMRAAQRILFAKWGPPRNAV